jgi:hypothetical protein
MTTSSLPSPAELKARHAALCEKYRGLIVRGDVVARQDCLAEIHAIEAQLRGAPAAAAKEPDPFFDRSRKKPAADDAKAELRKLVESAKASGLITVEDEPVKIEKNGIDVSASTSDGRLVQWIDITPAIAQRWLRNNFRNRPVTEDTVAAYARDMARGVWVSTHQGIAFNDRDELIDGQHRLLAIVRSGCTVRMMVTFGLPSEIPGQEMTTMDAVDRGRTRSVADQLKIQHGMKNGSVIAAICATIGSLCFGERTRRLSVGQTLEIYRAFQGPMDWIIERRPKAAGLKATGSLAAFTFALATELAFAVKKGAVGEAPASRIAEMFERLVGGEELVNNSPVAHLRAFLTSDDAKLLNRGTDRGLAELVLEAIRLEMLGAPIEKLELALDGANHFRAQQSKRVEKIAGLFRLPEAGK